MSSLNYYDVAVIGSGPSGSIAAQKLSSSGLNTILFEKALPPRYKTCGRGIVNRAFKYLPPIISSTFEKSFNQIEIHDHQSKFHYEVKRNSNFLFMVMRRNFDFELLEYARTSGVKIFNGCNVYDIIQMNDGVVLKTEKGDFKTAFVIGADGAQGNAIKKSGLKLKKKNLPAVECEIFVSDKDLERYC